MPHPARRLLPLVALLPLSPAAAQYPAGATVQQLPSPGDPSEKLAAALRTLAISPNDLSALIAAGQNALALGDPSAAAGFFGRADTVNPRDGRVKAGLASTLVQLGKPDDALRMFAQASALGVPDGDLAEDRGLAYDLVGDTTRAQADYRRVLAARPDDDDARRRLALSQGIAGDRAGAIATLDPLIRRRDIAAWRAQTFVLAMTGDPKGANDITRIMLPTQQAALQPFLVRLATLTPAQKARAVHFGEMPADRGYSPQQLASNAAAPAYAPPRAAAPQAGGVGQSDLAPVAPARTPVATTLQTQARTADRIPVAPSAAPGVRVAAVAPADAPLAQAALATAAPPPGPAPAVTVPQVAANAPPSVATALPMPMPMGSNAASGHFDVPSAAGGRRPAVRVATGAPASVARPVPAPPATIAARTDDAAVPAPIRSAGVEPVAVARPQASRPPAVAETSPPGASASAAPVRIASAEAVEPTRAEPSRAPAASSAEPSPSVRRAVPAPAIRRAPARTAPDGDDDRPGDTPGRRVAASRKPSTARTATDDVATDTTTPARPIKGGSGVTRNAALDRSEDEPAASRKERGAKSETPKRDDAGGAGAKGKRGTRVADADADKPARKGGADADETPAKKSRKGAGDEPAARGKAPKDKRDAKSVDEPASAKGTPSRVYVQVAGGANVADMDKAWGTVRRQAPELMKGKKPSTTPLRATNRLLVGPFKDEDEAQSFVNKMAGKGMSGFVFKSAKGQKVEKVDTTQ